jgi:hypothetical protein
MNMEASNAKLRVQKKLTTILSGEFVVICLSFKEVNYNALKRKEGTNSSTSLDSLVHY